MKNKYFNYKKSLFSLALATTLISCNEPKEIKNLNTNSSSLSNILPRNQEERNLIRQAHTLIMRAFKLDLRRAMNKFEDWFSQEHQLRKNHPNSRVETMLQIIHLTREVITKEEEGIWPTITPVSDED